MTTSYNPPVSQIGKILTSARFQKIYAETNAANPGNSVFSIALYAFEKYQGWTGGFFGLGEKPFAERFTLLQKLSTPESNAANYAANQYAGQPEFHAAQPDGEDLFFEVIPGYAKAAASGAFEGLENVEKTLKISIAIVAIIYAAPLLIKGYKAATN